MRKYRKIPPQSTDSVGIGRSSVAPRHVLVAIGVDAPDAKPLLGLADAATETARVLKALLSDLTARGVNATGERLFVSDGAKTVAAASKSRLCLGLACSAATRARCATSCSGCPGKRAAQLET